MMKQQSTVGELTASKLAKGQESQGRIINDTLSQISTYVDKQKRSAEITINLNKAANQEDRSKFK